MQMIYMTHPQHGAMHCYLEAEAESNAKNGWERSREPCAEPAVETAVDADKDPTPKLTIAQQYEEKFGRRPDGRWKEDRIKEEL